MEMKLRQDKIQEHLKIKPINHGQIEVCLLHFSGAKKFVDIPLERRTLLERSLLEQGSNLVPLIVRRIEATEDDREYEIVYGEDWFLTAEELRIDRLWVWVFDTTQDEAQILKREMSALVGSHEPEESISGEIQSIRSLINKVLSEFLKRDEASKRENENIKNILLSTEFSISKIQQTIVELTENVVQLTEKISDSERNSRITSSTHSKRDIQDLRENPLNLNEASINDLCQIYGIAGQTAESFIKERKNLGSFSSKEDLLEVPGFNRVTKTLERKIKEMSPELSDNITWEDLFTL